MLSLESRRTKAQLVIMYRIINNLVDVPASQYLLPASSRTRAANSHKYRQISTSTSYYKNSFFPYTIITWNTLPSAVAEAPNFAIFLFRSFTSTTTVALESRVTASTYDVNVDMEIYLHQKKIETKVLLLHRIGIFFFFFFIFFAYVELQKQNFQPIFLIDTCPM